MIPVTLFGYGYWGKILSREIESSGLFEIENIVDPYLEKENNSFTGPENLAVNAPLRSTGQKIAFVATPAKSHKTLVSELLKNGWDVFCEKPLCLSASDAKELFELSRIKSSILFVGHTYLHNPYIERMRSEIYLKTETKEDADPFALISHRLAPGPIRTDVGAHWDLASHDISIFLYLSGSSIKQAQVIAHSRKDSPTVEFVNIALEDESGNTASIHAGWSSLNKSRNMQLINSEFSLEFNETLLTNKLVKASRFNFSGHEVLEVDEKYSPVTIELIRFRKMIEERNTSQLLESIAIDTVSILEILENRIQIKKGSNS